MTKTKTPVHRLLALVALALLLLAGCGSSDDAKTATEAVAKTASGEFPLTLHNAHGDVTIPAKPERVVALGYADVALASALGADVVAAPKSYSSIDGASADPNLPYIEPLDDETTWINPMSINVEQLAALEPDVILATAAFAMDEAMYDQLSDIAPVVSYETQLYEAAGEESALRVGAALGEVAGARRLVARADAAIARLKRELPRVDGATFLYGQARDGVVVMLVDERNMTAKFMQQLGLVALPAVAGLGGKGSVPGAVDVSFEQAGRFNDAGVLFMTFQSDALQKTFERDPVVSEQPIMRTRYVPLELETATALQDPNVVAVPWLLDQLRPGLERIPAT